MPTNLIPPLCASYATSNTHVASPTDMILIISDQTDYLEGILISANSCANSSLELVLNGSSS
jgi:hypothetical protein